MLRLLNQGNYAGASEQFEKWDHSGGVEIAGLLRRRKAEEGEFNGV
jgi:lysozyme